MSLINDALKRATNRRRTVIQPGNGTAPIAPFLDGRLSRQAGVLPIIIVLLVIVAAGYGGWVWWQKKNAPPATTTASKTKPPAPATNNPIARAKATLEKVQDQNQEGERTAEAMKATNPPAAATTPTTTAVVNAQPSTPGDLRLQAVFFRLKKPSAVINGKTVFEGDEVEGARVLKIERKLVQVQQQDGSTKTLALQ
jgi:hypothetical protein